MLVGVQLDKNVMLLHVAVTERGGRDSHMCSLEHFSRKRQGSSTRTNKLGLDRWQIKAWILIVNNDTHHDTSNFQIVSHRLSFRFFIFIDFADGTFG